MQTPAENYEFEPDFAVVCSFLEKFGRHFGPKFKDLPVEEFKSFLESKEGRKMLKHQTT